MITTAIGGIMVALSALMCVDGSKSTPPKEARYLYTLGLVVVLAGVFLLPWFEEIQGPGINNTTLFAVQLGVVVLFLVWPTRSKLLIAVASMLVALGLWVGGWLVRTQTGGVPPESVQAWFYPHVVMALMAMACGVVSVLVAVLYLWQDRALKNGDFKTVKRLPKIGTLGAVLGQLIPMTALSFTLTVVLGSALSVYVWDKPFSADPFSLGALLGFALQVTLNIVRERIGWVNRTVAFGTLATFVFWVVIIALVFIGIPTEHSFG